MIEEGIVRRPFNKIKHLLERTRGQTLLTMVKYL